MSVTKANFAVCATKNGTYTEFRPQSIRQTNDSLASEDSGRSDNGVMHISWITPPSGKYRKWEIELPTTDSTTVYNLFNIVQGKKYYIKIFDMTSNSVQTVHVYTSNTQSECYSGVVNGGMYQGVSFSAIELGDNS